MASSKKEFIIKYTLHYGIPKVQIKHTSGGAGGFVQDIKLSTVVVSKTATEAIEKLRERESCAISINDMSVV